jgi:hypothetical protein
MYYSFPAHPHFRDVFAHPGRDYTAVFRAMGDKVLELYRFLQSREHPITFHLHPKSQHEFIALFRKYTEDSYTQIGTPLLATVHRLGLIGFRIGMVLTMFRYFTDPDRKDLDRIGIWQKDFAIAMDLVEHFLYHATVLHAEMKDGSRTVIQHAKNMELLRRLPDAFTRSKALETGKVIGLSSATVGRYLHSGPFERTGQGQYRKLDRSGGNDQVSN